MDRLPAELHDLIFSEACNDGGYTGRSLSLVSKSIRAVSAPYILHSVALYGSYQLAAFAAFLAQRAPEHTFIRHLFLTDRRRVWMERGTGQDKAAWVTKRMKEELHLKDPMRRADAQPIAQIMSAAAPHLRTLAFLLFDLYDERTLPTSFPVLREFTLHASTLTWRGAPSMDPCDALRRLHVIQDFSFPRAAVRTIAALGPRLTHLRISRLTTSRLAMGDLLAGLERMLEEQADAAAAPPAFPPSLERAIVEMGQQALYDADGALQVRSPVSVVSCALIQACAGSDVADSVRVARCRAA